MNRLTLTAALIFLLPPLTNCSSGGDATATDSDSAAIDLPLKVEDPQKLSSAQQDVYKKIEKHQAVSFREITKLMIEKHVQSSIAQHPDVSAKTIQEFIARITPATQLSPAQMKIAYESKIGTDLEYNIDKTSVVDIYADKTLQCYSGTYLYQLVRRQRGADAFRAGREVVIFESGHVLPGYMVMDQGNWRLIGIETTESGGARRHFGLAKDLSGVRVVDAELFALTEVFSESLGNPVEVAEAALKITAKKYGIVLNETRTLSLTDAASETKKQLNQSIFGFGRPRDITPGNRKRIESRDDGTRPDIVKLSGSQYVKIDAAEERKAPALESLEEKFGPECRGLAGIYTQENGNPRERLEIVGCVNALFTSSENENQKWSLLGITLEEEKIIATSGRRKTKILQVVGRLPLDKPHNFLVVQIQDASTDKVWTKTSRGDSVKAKTKSLAPILEYQMGTISSEEMPPTK